MHARFTAMLAAIALAVPARAWLFSATTVSGPKIVSVDFVKARPGQRDILIRYYRANWVRARVQVLATGGIVDYRMLVSADTGSRWDVVLETTYADSTAFARAETVFAPVLQAQGVTLIDGKRRADVADIVESRTATVDP